MIDVAELIACEYSAAKVRVERRIDECLLGAAIQDAKPLRGCLAR